MKRALPLLRMVVTFALIGVASPSSAFDRVGRWDANTDPRFPVIPVYGCPGRFATYFPAFPWVNIRSQALVAMNEWFVHGGADLRHRYQIDLADTDPRCTNQSVDNGTVLISAEKNNGGGNCFLATTFFPTNGNQEVVRSLLIMHQGTVCSGSFQAWNWATNADAPGPNQFDFQHVFLHELGHTLGLNHSADGNAIMFPSTGIGATRRTLANDDVMALTAPGATTPYATVQTNLFDNWTPNGGLSWGVNQNGTSSTFNVGGPAGCIDNDQNSSTYFGAFTKPDHTIQTFTYGASFVPGVSLVGAMSNLPPAVACGGGSKIVAWVDASTDKISYQFNLGGTWSSTITTSWTSGISPMLAEYLSREYVLAFTDPISGQFRTATSTNGGTTFGSLMNWSSFRTYHSGGIDCRSAICYMVFSDADLSYTPVRYVIFSLSSSGSVFLASGPTTLASSPNSYGADVHYDASGNLFVVWRDRGTATVLASTSSFGSTIHFSSSVTQSRPNGTWSNAYGTFAEWYSYNARYDQ